MKKNVFTLLLVLICTVVFSQKVIENPSFEVTKSGITHISKIELNESETKVYVHSTFIPKWWVDFSKDITISDCDSDKTYQVIGIEGAEFDEKIRIPESGEKTIVLVFPPFDEKVKKIDYNNLIFGISLIESNVSNEKTNGIPESVSKWIDSELAKVTKKPLENYYSSDFFSRSFAKLIGYIKGYDVRLGFDTGIMYMGNDITREDYPIVVQIYPDGRFEAELPLINPIYTYVRFGKVTIKPYLEPEQTLAMVLDWEEFLYADRYRNKRHKFKKIQFKGSLAAINEDLLNFDSKTFNYKAFQKKIKTQSPETFKKDEIRSYHENLEVLSTYLENNTISEKAKVLLENEIYLDYATHLFDFVSNRKYESKKDSINEILKIPVPENYYDFLQNINLNDQSLLVLDRFGIFVNRFEFSKPLSIYPKRKSSSFKPKKSFKEYLDEEKIVISDSDKKLMNENKKKSFKSLEAYNKYMEAFSEVYRNSLKAYSEKYLKPHNEEMSTQISMEKWTLRDSVLTNIFKLEKNLIYEIVKIRTLDFDIKRSTSENAHEYWDILKKDITHPFIKEEGARIVNKKFPIISTRGIDGNISTIANIQVTTTKLPKGRATDVFKKIMEPFKGKIVFVDFWATSCGPCVGSIKRMKDTREKYEGNKDFDFVFITDKRSSPETKYNKFVEEQELNNVYRLSLDDYNYLRQLFKFNGIPRYVVIDKKGDVIDDDFPMYNFDNLLDGILNKYK